MSNFHFLIVIKDSKNSSTIYKQIESWGFTKPKILHSLDEILKISLDYDVIFMDINFKKEFEDIYLNQDSITNFPIIYLKDGDKSIKLDKKSYKEPYTYLYVPFNFDEFRSALEIAIYKKKLSDDTKKDEKFSKDVLNAFTDSLFILDINGNLLDVNESTAERLNTKREDMIGVHFKKFIPHELAKSRWKYIKNAIDTGKFIEFEDERNGIYFQHNIYPLTINGKVDRVVINSHDITEQKNNENELIKINSYNRTLIEASIDPFATTDLNGKVTDVNNALTRVFGYTKDQVLGKDIINYFKDTNEALNGFQKVLDEGYVENYPLEILRKDGKSIPVIINASMYYDKKTETTGIFAAARDITEIKRFETELNKSKKRINAILDGSPIAQFAIDKDHKILFWNKALENMTGYKADDMIGTKNHCQAFYDKERPCMVDLLIEGYEDQLYKWYLGKYNESKLIKNAYEASEFFSSLGENGKWLYFTAAIINDDNGEIIAAVETLEDITQRKITDKALKQANLYNRSLIEANLDPLVTIGPDGKITDINGAVETVTGYSRDQVIGTDFSDYFTDRKEAKRVYKKVYAKGYVKDYPLKIRHKNGHITSVVYNATLYYDEDGDVSGVFAAARDITQIIETEKALKQSEEKFRTIIETAQEGIWTLDAQSETTYVNEAMGKMIGYTVEEMMGKSLYDFMDDEGKIDAHEKMERRKEGIKEKHDFRFKHKNGSDLWTIISTNPILDSNNKFIGALGMLTDITKRKEMEEELKSSLKEKDMLLKEIHHRVKNNLMVISSLLNLQSNYIKDKDDLDMFKESQTRAKSMALIHEKLYKSDDLKSIDFADYMKEIINELINTYKRDPNIIKLNLDLENIILDINTSIPLGLIVNELVSNSLKYAFPDNREGEINVSLKLKDGKYILIIGDNGVGIPRSTDFRNTASLGLQLVNNLTDQINGKIELDRSHGTEFKITFKEIF
jgi:PAS domain S-box-containing protein